MPYNTYTPTVIANTGCQYKFYPLVLIEGSHDDFQFDAEHRIADVIAHFAMLDKTQQNDIVTQANEKKWLPVYSLGEEDDDAPAVVCPYIKARFAIKNVCNSIFAGIEFAIETNQDDGTHRRGIIYKKFAVAADDENYAKFVTGRDSVIQPASVYNAIGIGMWSPEYTFNISEKEKLVLKIGFKHAKNQDNPVKVDLVCDFGNTRTVALLVEETGTISEIPQHCSPVRLKLSPDVLPNKKDILDVTNGIVNSWFVLHHTDFDKEDASPDLLEDFLYGESIPSNSVVKRLFGKSRYCITKKESRIPQMFVHCSPVVLGNKAENLLNDAWVANFLNHGANIEQSSPKRYYWDNQQSEEWHMIPMKKNDDILLKPSVLRAEILRYISESGKYVDPELAQNVEKPNPNPESPKYPRACTFVWMLVHILERAWRQLNINENDIDHFVLKKLKNVIVTYPSGWTKDQVDVYRERCQEAIDIFQKMNFTKDDQDVKLIMDLDEAVASQIPYVFSEIHEFNNNAEAWIKIAGKIRNNKSSVRIMNFDIGGGTTDIAIIEYSNASKKVGIINLIPTLLYKNGITFGGDDLLKGIILDIVLNSISKQVANASITPQTLNEQLVKIFTNDIPKDKIKQRIRILRLCLIPFAIKILSDISTGIATGESACLYLADASITATQWQEATEFFDSLGILGFPGFDARYEYSPREVNNMIQRDFTELLKYCASVAAENDIDIFFMSGKTSEQPCLMQLAQDTISLPKNRIVAAKNYRVGNWYPFISAKGTIEDAKSVTAVGAALYTLLQKGTIPSWRIQKPVSKLTQSSEWGLFDTLRNGGEPFFKASAPDNHECCEEMRAEYIIAKRMSPDSESEPVYKFRRKDGVKHGPDLQVRLQKKREDITSELPSGEKCVVDVREYLQLVSVVDAGKDTTDEYELIICQENAGAEKFWQDSGLLS